MAVQKTYFVLKGIFEYFRDYETTLVPIDTPVTNARATIRMSSYKIDGIEQVMNTPVSAGSLTLSNGEQSECNQDMSTCAIGGIANSYNPFYSFIRMDFPLVNGKRRGTSTGSTNGTNYGFNSLNLTIDKTEILDGFGVSRFGAFAIDIDFDFDFYLKFTIDVPTTSEGVFPYGQGVVFEMQHVASECSSTFTATYGSGDAQVIENIYSYGFLKGVDVGEEARDYHIVPSCFELTPVDVCEGFSGYGIGIMVGKPSDDTPQIIKKTCCETLKVFAEQTTKETNYKNDYKSLIFKRQTENDTYDFILKNCDGVETPLIDNTYGEFYDFGDFEDYPDYKGIKLDWFEVLNNLGSGKYKLITNYNIAGFTGSYETCVYELNTFSFEAAAYTVRFDSVLNSYYESQDIDLTGLFWQDSIRVQGTWGYRQIETQIDNYIQSGRTIKDIKTDHINNYTFESELISRCASPVLLDWILRGDELYVSDFFPYAHKDYKDFPIKLNEYGELGYFGRNDSVTFKAEFGDRILNQRKL
jgi:hypothetical protein